MNKLVTLFVLFASFSAFASCEDNPRYKNCMIVKKDKEFCTMMICSNARGMNQLETEIPVDGQCFEALLEEIGPAKAAEACPTYDYDLEINYDNLIE